jgi:hypothetical protein
MLHRISFGTLALTGALMLLITAAAAHDASKYPDWSGQWRRAPGTGIIWDETKPRGLAQQPPLTPEYQAIWEASMADQAAGGQGGDTRVTCVSNGMPRMAIIVRPLAFFIQDDMTLVVYDNNIPRWIYTDGREMPKDAEPSYAGYSIGKWLDTDGDGRFDTLEVETRNMKGPRTFDGATGIPLHKDNQTVVKERFYADKADRDVIHNEVTTIDHALTRPWTAIKTYRREKSPVWFEENCSENNTHVSIGNEDYVKSWDGLLMPARKDQAPPDLRYFKRTQK